MKPVLCVRNDPQDTLGIVEATLKAEGVPLLRVDGFEASARLPAVDQLAGLIVFGGEMNVDETARFPWLLTERRLLTESIAAGVPVLGICLGAQMLARALDARVYPAPVRELGFHPITITQAGRRDPLTSVFESGDRVFQWHEDTFDLPKGATLLACGDQVEVQAFRYGEQAWGIQFHFEVDRTGVEAWLRACEGTLSTVWKREPAEVRAELELHLGAQQERSRRLLAAFARRLRSS